MLRVDQFSPALDSLMQRGGCVSAAFITAWNPLGVEISGAANEALQAQMLRDLDVAGFPSIEGFGSDPTSRWPGEASRLVLGMSRRQACESGQRQQQNAVLWSGADAVPRLLLLR